MICLCAWQTIFFLSWDNLYPELLSNSYSTNLTSDTHFSLFSNNIQHVAKYTKIQYKIMIAHLAIKVLPVAPFLSRQDICVVCYFQFPIIRGISSSEDELWPSFPPDKSLVTTVFTFFFFSLFLNVDIWKDWRVTCVLWFFICTSYIITILFVFIWRFIGLLSESDTCRFLLATDFFFALLLSLWLSLSISTKAGDKFSMFISFIAWSKNAYKSSLSSCGEVFLPTVFVCWDDSGFSESESLEDWEEVLPLLEELDELPLLFWHPMDSSMKIIISIYTGNHYK